MKERNELIILYDFYGELLSDLEKLYFECYYFNNYSLGEIADNYDISRNAVHKHIKNAENKLVNYEDKLKLYYKYGKLNKVLDEIEDEKLVNKIKNIFE